MKFLKIPNAEMKNFFLFSKKVLQLKKIVSLLRISNNLFEELER